MTPRQNDLLLIALLAVQALIAGVVLTDPADLGLSTTLVKWLVIINPILSLIANQLKALGAKGSGQSPLQKPPNDPMADRPEVPEALEGRFAPPKPKEEPR